MKQCNPIKTIAFLLIGLLLGSCGKLDLLKDKDSQSVPAGQNLLNETIWEFLSSTSNISTDTLKSLDLFAKALERTGLKDMLNSDGEYTVIAPRDVALKAYIQSLGYDNIDDIPTVVLKNIFLANIVNKRIDSYTLPANEVQKFETLNNDSISFVREPSTSNPYIVRIFSASSFLSTNIRIRSQNLKCKNGIVHVVDSYTMYAPKTNSPDASEPGSSILTDTIFVTKDAYLTNGSGTKKNSNYGNQNSLRAKKASADFTSRSITQFAVRQPAFTERIGTIRMGLYSNRVDGDGGVISLFEDEHIDWLENTVSWNNSPTPGSVEIGSVGLTTGSVNKWHNIDITRAYQEALTEGKTFINIGINTADNDLYTFTSKEAGRDFSPYIIISSPEISVLKNPVNTGVIVSADSESKILTTSELAFTGATDKNIFFIIKDAPQNGYLVVSGKPVFSKSSFSQEQLRKGAVRYIPTGTSTTDSFTVEGQDFQGGFFDDILTVNIEIQ